MIVVRPRHVLDPGSCALCSDPCTVVLILSGTHSKTLTPLCDSDLAKLEGSIAAHFATHAPIPPAQ